ncbi:uncharacterized protein LOC126905438 [Daktulosphaira vitifoliae]|uniref:uncharacterized protein LOC126905438 n=1 Tax=Daktulosphaira vitifoliae TaxID=58002 RepID=UPI0021AA32C5|nr:uncharacterized protein LOC126905438 [Daktulosphaira vitifoliae]
MSERRTLLSRPRTRVYDCNYNIGEGYYKPMMDHLDRKYYGGSTIPSPKPARSLFDSHKLNLSPSTFDDFQSSSPIRSRRGSDSRLSMPEDDFEQEIAALRKARAAKAAAARTASLEREFESAFNGLSSDGMPRSRFDYTGKVLDSVGLNSKAQEALEKEITKKRTKSYFQEADEFAAAAEQQATNKWIKAKIQDDAEERFAEETAAIARARKSKARLLDIQNELDDLADRDAARQKRSADLRALFADNEALTESANSVFKKKSSKKVSF